MSESKRKSSRGRVLEICLIPLMATIIFASKWVMQSLPNIEPVSFFIIVFSLTFKIRVVLPAVYIYVFLEFATKPSGIWMIPYLYVWGILCIFTYLCKGIKNVHFWSVASAVFGFMFGLFCTIPTFIIGGWTLGVTWWTSGIYFDILHFFGNFVIMRWLYTPMINAMQKINNFLK